jgi:hypothetical protein
VLTAALVESPAQLLNVLEWADQSGEPAGHIMVNVLAPTNERSRRQLRAVAALAKEVGLDVAWQEPRLGGAETARTVRALAGSLVGVSRLVVGDPFSGVIQVVLSVVRAEEVVIVDDGTATMEFARQWLAGENLSRWHQRAAPGQRRQIATFARDQISASVRRRLGPGSACILSAFSCLPVDLGRASVVPNTYAWTKRRFARPSVKPGADLVGTSLVENGVVELGAYLEGVALLRKRHDVDRYFAHRKESDVKLERIRALGLRIVRPELPLEVAARTGEIGARVISFPSTVVHTLPLALSDTAAEVVVCDIGADWLTTRAAARSDEFLRQVNSTARTRFGLATITC